MNAALKTTSGSEKRILEFDLSAELHHGVVVSNLAYAVAEELGLPHDQCYQLAIAGMLHDIGKTVELSAFPMNDYTDDGQLLGHIMIGTEMIHDMAKEIPGFPAKLESELKHCILAHHGELEYGSPKKPALAEAAALNLADNTDAKMETITEIFRSAGDNKDWLGYNRFFESNLRKTQCGEE